MTQFALTLLILISFVTCDAADTYSQAAAADKIVDDSHCTIFDEGRLKFQACQPVLSDLLRSETNALRHMGWRVAEQLGSSWDLFVSNALPTVFGEPPQPAVQAQLYFHRKGQGCVDIFTILLTQNSPDFILTSMRAQWDITKPQPDGLLLPSQCSLGKGHDEIKPKLIADLNNYFKACPQAP